MEDSNYRKRFGFEEMMVHVPLCSHKYINNVLVVGEVTDLFKNELNKHNANVTFTQELNLDETTIPENGFDIILYTKSSPDEFEVANIQRYLEQSKGILVAPSVFIYKNIEAVKKDLATIGKNFWICMPYTFGHNTLIFASHKYHPQAEIVLQVSDLLDGCEYYNSDFQNASFIHPTYITKAITGIAKR